MDKSSLQKFRDSLESALVKAHKSIIWIECFDYDFIMDIIKKLCDNNSTLNSNNIRIWNGADMFERDMSGKVVSELTSVEDAAGKYVLEGEGFAKYNEEKHSYQEKRFKLPYKKSAIAEIITEFSKKKR